MLIDEEIVASIIFLLVIRSEDVNVSIHMQNLGLPEVSSNRSPLITSFAGPEISRGRTSQRKDNPTKTSILVTMGEVTIHGAPGLPDGALHSTVSSAFFSNYSPSIRDETLKRSYATFATDVDTLDSYSSATDGALFHAEQHLIYQPPKKIHTMTDLALPSNNGVSPVAVSEPFPLFSEEAIDIMRAEIFSDVIQENYSYTSDIAPKQLRGYAPK